MDSASKPLNRVLSFKLTVPKNVTHTELVERLEDAYGARSLYSTQDMEGGSFVVRATNEDYFESMLANPKVTIQGQEICLKPIESPSRNILLKYSPVELPCDVIVDSLKPYGEVISSSFEKLKGKEHILTGTRIIRFKKTASRLPNSLVMGGYRVQISYQDGLLLCLTCKQPGHLAPFCKNMKCSKRQKGGDRNHEAKDCPINVRKESDWSLDASFDMEFNDSPDSPYSPSKCPFLLDSSISADTGSEDLPSPEYDKIPSRPDSVSPTPKTSTPKKSLTSKPSKKKAKTSQDKEPSKSGKQKVAKLQKPTSESHTVIKSQIKKEVDFDAADGKANPSASTNQTTSKTTGSKFQADKLVAEQVTRKIEIVRETVRVLSFEYVEKRLKSGKPWDSSVETLNEYSWRAMPPYPIGKKIIDRFGFAPIDYAEFYICGRIYELPWLNDEDRWQKLFDSIYKNLSEKVHSSIYKYGSFDWNNLSSNF